MKLESIGKILAGGFGDRVAIGLLMGLWENVGPGRLYEYIRDDIALGYKVTDDEWANYKRMAQAANLGDITAERVIKELRDRRPDLLGVILNHPPGRDWLDRQIIQLKKRLGIE